MVSIFDVAREAGVSKSTVSRVINQEASVRKETREIVEDAIQRLGYSPSYFAKGIRTGKTSTIAMMVPEYANIFYTEMFRGVEDIALKYGYMVLVCNTERHMTSEIEYTKELLKRNIDGIIYNTYHKDDSVSAYLREVSNTLPVVFMNNIFDAQADVAYVYTDGFSSTRKAVRYLFNQGKRRIGYVKNSEDISVLSDRFQGYLQGLEDCGLEPEEKWVYQVRRETEPDYIKLGGDAARYYISLAARPDSILTATDMIGIGCIKEFNASKISIPNDISIIGFDNISLGNLIEPALTTISQPIRKLGQTAAEIIFAKISGEKIQEKVVFEGALIVRQST